MYDYSRPESALVVRIPLVFAFVETVVGGSVKIELRYFAEVGILACLDGTGAAAFAATLRIRL
jgi:hypothetical protein